MGIGVHRHANLRVAEHFHDGARGHALSEQERGTSVPQVMQSEPVQARRLTQLVPATVDVTRLDRCADGIPNPGRFIV
jgi:hypothetical protein